MNAMARTVKIRHVIAAALGSLLSCFVAGAQMRGGASSGRVSSGRVGPVVRMSSFSAPAGVRSTAAQGIRQATVIRILPNGRVTSNFVSSATSISLGNINGVPGLGFDYPHLVAVSGSLQNNLRSGRVGRRGQGSFVPIFFGGYPYYPYYDDSQDYDQSQPQTQPQAQVIVVQQPLPQAAGQQGSDSGNEPTTSSPAAASVPDIGDFILVRRDGRILFASVFSVVGTQMQYVSPDENRHTLPMSDLDANATQQMNEARGTTVQFSN